MKRLAVFLIIMGLMIGALPSFAAADELDVNGRITIEKAIEITKGLFTVSKSFDQFDSTYEQNDYGDVWSLRWYNDKGDGELNVRVDAQTGEIAGYHSYNSADYSGIYSSIPKVTREEGEIIAREFIKKASPSKSAQIILKPDENIYYGGPVFHRYFFNRVINGIEYPENHIQVEVNGQTGQVRNFYIAWENIRAFPEEAKLTREDAEKIFTEKIGFELKYFRPQPNSTDIKPIIAVYEINNPFQVTIDALTGEILPYVYYSPYYDAGMGGMEKANINDEASLEPFEQRVADELKELISREKALEIAERAVDLPENYILNSSSLNKDWGFPELRVWSFHWNLEEKDRYGWAGAEIDARTGKVLAFDYRRAEDNVQIEQRPLKIKTKAAAEQIVERYLRDNYPETAGSLREQSVNYEVRPMDGEENNQPSYYFSYERLADGIPFGQNYVHATVDSYSGEITNFRIRFLEMEFPGTQNVLEKSRFTADFLVKNQLILVYAKDQDKNLRLVYKLAPIESYRFNAETGEMLDYNGEPVKDKKAGEITDIKGHWAEGDINTLNQMDLLHYEKGLFQPDSRMTQAELIKVLVKSQDRYLTDAGEGNWYDNYYRAAKQSGLIPEKEINPGASFTRQDLAKYIVRTLVGDKIARLNIYQVPYKDREKVSQGYEGYVAIVHGLKIMTGDGTNFNPQAMVKRGEACSALIRYLKTEK